MSEASFFSLVMRQSRGSEATKAVFAIMRRMSEASFFFLVMRQSRGSEATEAVFAFRQKSLFLAGRTSVGCQQ